MDALLATPQTADSKHQERARCQGYSSKPKTAIPQNLRGATLRGSKHSGTPVLKVFEPTAPGIGKVLVLEYNGLELLLPDLECQLIGGD
mgnify:CR=1 FL=1